MLTCFGMIWNLIIFQDKTQNLTKFLDFKNSYLFQKNYLKWHIRTIINTINNKFQNISFENSSK